MLKLNGLDIFDYKWGNKVVTGEEKPDLPLLANFINSARAIEILHKHLLKKSNIAIHCDVDVDGVGTGYILGKFIQNISNIKPIYIINRDKEHGIQQKHVDFFKGKPLDLIIIVDSSSNETDIIKQFNCDVIVVDHHEIGHMELHGSTLDDEHEFVIVNNTIDNSDIYEIKCLYEKNNKDAEDTWIKPYIREDRMSCGLVIYELLRLYEKVYKTGNILYNLRLYQWVGVTLFTDAILLNTPRNQWYIENTVHSMEVESTLKTIIEVLNPYKFGLDKSLISYKIAPIINKAIRAGASGEALNIILYNPGYIQNLLKYGSAQDEAISVGIRDIKEFESFVLRDMSDTGVSKNYNGVIASRLCGEYNKNTVVFIVNNGIAEGSFRGRVQGVDYREIFDTFSNETSGQGHKVAFGFKCPEKDLIEIMSSLKDIEEHSEGYLLTAGKINSESPGKFVISDMEDFKRQGGIWKLGIGNSKLSTDEQVMITVSASDATLIETRGKLYLYNVLGLTCKAFEPITSSVINIYVEYSKQIDCYIK